MTVSIEDYAFFEDQKGWRIGKCLHAALSLTASDKKFIRHSESQLNATCLFIHQRKIALQFAVGYASETESLASSSTDIPQSEFVAKTSNSSQNCKT